MFGGALLGTAVLLPLYSWVDFIENSVKEKEEIT